MKPPTPAAHPSRLLSRLPREVLQQLEPHLSRVACKIHQVIYEYQATIDYVYFPTRCILSALVVMQDGRTIEVGNIGSEGGAGLSVVAGPATSPHRVIVQVADGALRMRADILRRAAECDGPLRTLILKYQASYFSQVSQSAACNGLHPIEKRCCRWLMMTHDRLQGDELPLTHELLAMMLGVRRAGVTEVLQNLQKKRLVHCGRGKVIVLDRQELAAHACECYHVVNHLYDRLLG